jgi:hypothetical protein
MSAAYVRSDGTVIQLDGKRAPDAVITAQDVENAEKLARMVQDLARRIAVLERGWGPARLFFRDLAVTSTTTDVTRLEHGLGGLVNWSVVRWRPTTPGDAVTVAEHADTDEDTLCIVSGTEGVVSLLVELAG